MIYEAAKTPSVTVSIDAIRTLKNNMSLTKENSQGIIGQVDSGDILMK